ncbi:ThuA domain-containing protein [Parapedobacter tibetensis]|uniref:ThuA domain-containing protein n=1 Tax=Parapedobacter tibetensis TaxID=2972951 RepID=UPI00214DE17D|nr:ThuA domain-containing protein [Parapedobacter tibetensis]
MKRFNKTTGFAFCLLLAMITGCQVHAQPKILVFSKTTGFRHDNIEKGAATIKQLGATHGFLVDHTEEASKFTDESLRQYRAVVFLSTTGTVLDDAQKAAFMRYIQAGNGYVGIHAASDTEYQWPWYGKMVGAYFMSHPQVQAADLHVVDRKHSATKHLPKTWNRTDEWYDLKDLNREVNLLMKLDEQSYQGGKMGDYHPIAWYHEYDGGRAFYTGLGHTKESFDEPAFQQHIVGAIWYAIGQ